MKILINSTTAFIGGGIQVGVSMGNFILSQKLDFDFIFAISKPIYNNLPKNQKKDSRVIVFEESPSRLIKGYKSRKKLKELEISYKPDIIYSLSFPSYTKFKTKEIGRYTNPWEIFSAELAWALLPLYEKLIRWLKNQYRLFWAKRAAYFETQTEHAKRAIIKRFKIDEDKVKVSTNVINPIFDNDPLSKDYSLLLKKNTIKLFSLSADHRHKNLLLIPDILNIWMNNNSNKNLKFFLTLPLGSKTWKNIYLRSKKLSLSNNIVNIGPLKLDQCIRWYKNSDFIFLPTVLEVMSATYLESMLMKKVIITSDLQFAREVCGNGAAYFKPNDPEDASLTLEKMINNPKLCNSIISEASEQIKKFPNFDEKHRDLFNWITHL
tara:strand:- start:5541 stop:6677 length:1137 start_codon:yes stop_codon:yes gene_type:complete